MKTIEPADFDLSTKQKWSPETCLLSQAGIRQGIEAGGILCTPASEFLSQLEGAAFISACRLMAEFDQHFDKPGDETKPELVALRASLPITL